VSVPFARRAGNLLVLAAFGSLLLVQTGILPASDTQAQTYEQCIASCTSAYQQCREACPPICWKEFANNPDRREICFERCPMILCDGVYEECRHNCFIEHPPASPTDP